jgi:hypothetical protein
VFWDQPFIWNHLLFGVLWLHESPEKIERKEIFLEHFLFVTHCLMHSFIEIPFVNS